jgi:hypothetical protein
MFYINLLGFTNDLLYLVVTLQYRNVGDMPKRHGYYNVSLSL